jgi:D-sedoheptulose 7-phosphate isomerase
VTSFDAAAYLKNEHAEHLAVANGLLAKVADPFNRLVRVVTYALGSGGKVLFFGNGGSAGDAQHLAAELVVKYSKDRTPLGAVALTTDTSVLTATVNDFGPEHVFVRQVQAIGRKGDVAFGISTSGNSLNVLKALEAAKGIGMTPVGLAGGTGGKMVGLADPLLIVPSTNSARIQEMHIFLGQVMCGAVERGLGLV